MKVTQISLLNYVLKPVLQINYETETWRIVFARIMLQNFSFNNEKNYTSSRKLIMVLCFHKCTGILRVFVARCSPNYLYFIII